MHLTLPLLLCLLLQPHAAPERSEGAGAASQPLTLHTFQQFHLGMPVTLELYAPDADTAQAAGRAAFARVAELDGILSDWNPDSELNQLCATHGEPVRVSDELFTVLDAALTLAAETDGAFDPTAGPVIRLWRQARRDGTLPNPDAMADALACTGHQHVTLDHDAQTVTLALPDMQLDLGGIAKGYIGDQAVQAMRDAGAPACLYRAGGDMVAGDAPPETPDDQPAGWRVDPTDYADPGETDLAPVHLANQAIAISGDTSQFVIIDGTRYSHVVDPRTGQGITTRRMAVVVADRGLVTDALATTGTVLDADAHAALVAQYPTAHAWTFTARD